jgi:hypothetical protein
MNPVSVPKNVLKWGYNPVAMADTFGRMKVSGVMAQQARKVALKQKSQEDLEKEFNMTLKAVIPRDNDDILNNLTKVRTGAANLVSRYGSWDLVPDNEKIVIKRDFDANKLFMESSAKQLTTINQVVQTINTDLSEKVNKQASMANVIEYLKQPIEKRNTMNVGGLIVLNEPEIDVEKVINEQATKIKSQPFYGKNIPGVYGKAGVLHGAMPNVETAKLQADIMWNDPTDIGRGIQKKYKTYQNFEQSFVSRIDQGAMSPQYIAPNTEGGEGSKNKKPYLVQTEDFKMPVSPLNATSPENVIELGMTNVQDVINPKPFDVNINHFSRTDYTEDKDIKLRRTSNYSFTPYKVGDTYPQQWNMALNGSKPQRVGFTGKQEKVIYGYISKLKGDGTEISRTAGYIPYDEYENKLLGTNQNIPKQVTKKVVVKKQKNNDPLGIRDAR